eukprot:scaffold509_cov149-Skeletonema_dohrnii-CCMP3373.AAC.2
MTYAIQTWIRHRRMLDVIYAEGWFFCRIKVFHSAVPRPRLAHSSGVNVTVTGDDSLVSYQCHYDSHSPRHMFWMT